MTSHPESFDDLQWGPDRLGAGYECVTLDFPDSTDNDVTPRAVLVRALPDKPTSKPALLWVHGMSDYFFQTHVAEHYLALGYPFYALDLRGCGRAHVDGERFHYITDVAHYYPELSSALRLLADQHGSVIPMAHSTGGLIVPLWTDELRRTDPQTHAKLQGIVLNSPWLDMQFSKALVTIARPLANLVGGLIPTLGLPNGGESTYGQSISADLHGEWTFDATLKPPEGHKKYAGWIRAIFQAQKHLHAGIDAGVPVLTLHSSHSYLGKKYSPAADTADTVLDVEDIARLAPTLSKDSTEQAIDGARHDVFLSEAHARETAFSVVDKWLDNLNETAKDTK